MAIASTQRYKYFLYSDEQLKEKTEILAKTGKTFTPGTVVVNGTRQKFTQLSDKPTLGRFIDTKIVAEGYVDKFTFTEPIIAKKRGN